MTDQVLPEKIVVSLSSREFAATVEAVFEEPLDFTIVSLQALTWMSGYFVSIETAKGRVNLHTPHNRMTSGQITRRPGAGRQRVDPDAAVRLGRRFMDRVFPWSTALVENEILVRPQGFGMERVHRLNDVTMPHSVEIDMDEWGEITSFHARYEPDAPEPVVTIGRDQAIAIAGSFAAERPGIFYGCPVEKLQLWMNRVDDVFRTFWGVEMPPGFEEGVDWRDRGFGGYVWVDAATGEVMRIGQYK